MEQTVSRLRKSFHYPADNDSDDSAPEALDEEEQENLIRTLHQENISRNKLYTRILLSLPLLSIPLYLPTLFSPKTTILSLLSISSLLSTAYLLYTLSPGTTGIPRLDAINTPSSSSAPSTPSTPSQYPRQLQEARPIITYLPYLNLSLCILLAIAGLLHRGKEGELWYGFRNLPGVVYVVILVAKVIMGSVDPEGELGSLRYEFKGA